MRKLSQNEGTEPAENTENTEKLGNAIMVSEIFIFTLAVENFQFNWDQCNITNFSEKGIITRMWMKQNPSEDCIHFGHCRQVCK